MIVRIATEGQYELDGEAAARLNELDHEAVAACDSGDEARFRGVYDQLLGEIRASGRRLAEDELSESDVIFPPPDVSLAEAKAGFGDEGLIPG